MPKSFLSRALYQVNKHADKVQNGLTSVARQTMGIGAKATGTLTAEQRAVADVVFPQLDCLKPLAVQKLLALTEDAVSKACDRGRPEVSRVGLKLALESLRAAVQHVAATSALGGALDVSKLKVPPGVLVQAAMVATGLYNEIVESLKSQMQWEPLCVEIVNDLVELMQIKIVQDRACLDGLKKTGKGLVEINIAEVQRKWTKQARRHYKAALLVARKQIGLRLTVKSREIVEAALTAYATSGQCAPPIDAGVMCSGMTSALSTAVAQVNHAAAASTHKLAVDIISRGAYGALDQPNIVKYKGFKKSERFVEEVVAAKIEDGGAGGGTTEAVVAAFSGEAFEMPTLLVAIVQELVASVATQIDALFAKLSAEGSAEFDFAATAVAPLLARWQAESNVALDRATTAARDSATTCVPGMSAVVMTAVVDNLLAQAPFSSALLRGKTATHHDAMVEAGVASTKDTVQKYSDALGETLATPLRGYCAAAWVRTSLGSVVPAITAPTPPKNTYTMKALKHIGDEAAQAQIGGAVDRMNEVCETELAKINGEWLGTMMMETWQSVGPLRSVLVTGSTVTLDVDTTTFDAAAFTAEQKGGAAASGGGGGGAGAASASAASAAAPPAPAAAVVEAVAVEAVVTVAVETVDAVVAVDAAAAAVPATEVISDGVFELKAWLDALGMGEHEHKLRDEGFDTVTTLRELEKDDLKEIGITKLGHRKAIIKAITTL